MANKTGVSSQAISLPQGAAKNLGMGESFSTDLSTGVASLQVPFSLPAARGNVQPSLGLSYSSAGGNGVAGMGWDLGIRFIARQTDRGLPQYIDPASGGPWTAAQDRFVFNGGQELVPICLVSGATCSGAAAGEVMPLWATGWQYFRPRVETAFMRFFWSPDHRTWRVQSKSGATMELGVPLAAPPDYGELTDAVEVDPTNSSHIFRWNIVREYDTHGGANPSDGSAPAPVNVVVYQYTSDGGLSYLTDVYDTPPASGPTSAPLASYAHHARLVYDFASRPDVVTSYRHGWPTTQAGRLTGIDVSSQTFGLTGRQLVRRYHLAYDGTYHLSMLTSVQMEGRCAVGVANCTQSVQEDATGGFPQVTGFSTLPAMTFTYQHVTGFDASGQPLPGDVPGFEAFDETIHSMASSPDHSLDESLTDLFDVNADGLPDVVVTAPYLYGGNDAVFFNGAAGQADTFTSWQPMQVVGVNGDTSDTIRLDNPNVAALDATGEGVIDLVNMPVAKTYSVYTPLQLAGGLPTALLSGEWAWQGRAIPTSSQQNVNVDFTSNNPAIRVMDVNADGLVDIVFSSGTEYQTFFALGRYPGGDTQFGYWDTNTQSISNDPATFCLPWDGEPVLLSDADIRVADMNGDGLPDLVRVRPGDVRYWPGRGNGYWGTGDPRSCPAGSFGQAQDVVMSNSPQIGTIDSTETLLVDDINGDGLDDVVKVEFNAVYIWLNVDGTGWAGPHVVNNAPERIPSVNRVRLVDINGSGTRDILYGDTGVYRYLDLNGGARPWVLTQYQNGRGATTSISYGTSTQIMLAAANATPWSSVAPMPLQVVIQVTRSDNLALVQRPTGTYVTQYTYRDPVYDGRQREFRGFSSVVETSMGDANSPTSSTQTSFLLGQCLNDEGWSPDPCTPEGMWEDNPREALKGLPVVSEEFDGNGVYASTTHHTYRLRKLYTGLDGREVRTAFESQTDTFPYDDGPYSPTSSPTQQPLTDVELETNPCGGSGAASAGSGCGAVATSASEGVPVRAATGIAHVHRSLTQDLFGNTVSVTDDGCIQGCATADESIVKTTLAALPSGDPTGWAYRTVESYVTGSLTSGRLNDLTTSYDAYGEPLETDAVLSGTLALDRFHETGAATAGDTAPAASYDGVVIVSAQKYDPTLGVLVQETGPDGRCRQLTYDKPFSELPIQESEYVGDTSTPCSGSVVQTVAIYDRGFGGVTSIIDVHGELTEVEYDGLGRTTAFLSPDPVNVGSVSSVPNIQIQYVLPTPGNPVTAIHTQTVDGATQPGGSTTNLRDAWTYIDGLDRTIGTLAQADPSAGDGGQWVASGLSAFDARGRTRLAYLPWFTNVNPSGGAFPFAGVTPPTAASAQRYDSFGRVLQASDLDGTLAYQATYHALSVDHWDADDLMPGPHQGTPATTAHDGHGRTVSVTERVHNGSAIESHLTTTTYRPTGEPLVVTRSVAGGAFQVTRWMQYDTLGRLVLNVEPDTTTNFGPPGSDPSAMKAWRYAYDDAGDIVGTSDARGCGANYYFDAGGRVLAEDDSPCLASQAPYSPPNLTTGDGTEAYYLYDQADPEGASIPGFPNAASFLQGRLSSVSDRGEKTVFAYDGRGRVIAIARQMAAPTAPGVAADALAERFTSHWYLQTSAYDAADRTMVESTGMDSDVPALLGAGGSSAVTTTYAQSGAVASVGSSYGPLIAHFTRTADDLLSSITYGDVGATTTGFTYDTRRRLATRQTFRAMPSVWTAQSPSYSPAPAPSGPPSTYQLLLEDSSYTYDSVDNPVAITDFRNPAEWPSGAQPVTRTIQYDDLNRVTQVGYQYPKGVDPWVDPFSAEDGGESVDARLATPSPHQAFNNRVLSEGFQFDWLGNTTRTTDDANGFYDRSLGVVTNGTGDPYQLTAASGADGSGTLSVAYDPAGNVVSMALQRSGGCLPAGAVCSQRFAYDWDEVGRLVRARRWDLAAPGSASDPLPGAVPAADLRYAYDANNGRTLKTAVDDAGNQLHTVYVFDSLELRRTSYGISATNATPDFDRAPSNEVGYLFSGSSRIARLEYEGLDVPTASGGQVHVLLELSDSLGSTSVVIDAATSELVEAASYRAFGGVDSDYRPARWDAFREDYRFTGKEDDAEVGLAYFGERYFMPPLGRWASPDPLAVHGLGADLNLYAYVHGELLRSTDPTGLDSSSPGSSLASAVPAASPSPNIPAGAYFTTLPSAQGGNASSVTFTSSGDLEARAQQEGATIFQADPKVTFTAQDYVSAMGELGAWRAQLGLTASGQGGTSQTPGGQAGGQAVGNPAGTLAGQPGAVGPSAGQSAPAASGGAVMDLARAYNGDTGSGNPAPSGAKGVPGGTGDHSAGDVGRALYVGAALLDLATTAIGAAQALKSLGTSGIKAVAEAFKPCGLCFALGTSVLTKQGPRAIEDLRVGERVVAIDDDGGASSDAQSITVDAAAWRDVRLVMADPETTSDLLTVEMLRPWSWLQGRGIVRPGPVYLSIPEMGLTGIALVEAVESAPTVAPGPGSLVLSTISHVSDRLRRLTFKETTAALEPTETHPLYSREAGGWTPASALEAGDHIATRSGWLTVRTNTAEPGLHRVYNIEVSGSHTYYAGDGSVLSHNAVPCVGGIYALRDAAGKIVRTGRTNNLARRMAEHLRDPELKKYAFEVLHRTDSYAEQRGLEQMVHNLYKPALNKIRPISPWNPNMPRYMSAAQKFLGL